ncbi:MAG: hypothetical protein KJN72_10665 [Woeseia sp.]|nr:hypothetical protein [Woeseia sp.]
MNAPPYTKSFHELAEFHQLWDNLIFPYTQQQDGKIEVWIATGSQAWRYAAYQYRPIPPSWANREGWRSASDFRRWRCKPMVVCPYPESPLLYNWKAIVRGWMHYIVLDTGDTDRLYINTLALALRMAGAGTPITYIPQFGHAPEELYDE